MAENGDHNERTVEPKLLLEKELLMQIPTDPTKSEIVEILSKNPAVISYIQNIITEYRKNISMKKITLEKKEREYEQRVSKTRMDVTQKYQERLKEHIQNEPEEIKKLCTDTGISKVDAREIVRTQRPDKPTANDLKDMAIIRNNQFYNEEVLPLKEEIANLEEILDSWKVKYNLFENNFKASQSIKGLIQNEEKLGGGS